MKEIERLIRDIDQAVIEECVTITSKYIREMTSRIKMLCENEVRTSISDTISKYEDCCMMPKDAMMATDEYVKMLSMKRGYPLEINCNDEHFRYIRALVKREIPTFRVRTIRREGNWRLIARVDDGE